MWLGCTRLGHQLALAVGQAVGVDEGAQPLQRAAPPGVGDVAVGAQRGPQPRRGGDVPHPGPGAGQVEVDQRDRHAVAEDDVVQVRVVVADQPRREPRRHRQLPRVAGSVERRHRVVVAMQQPAPRSPAPTW